MAMLAPKTVFLPNLSASTSAPGGSPVAAPPPRRAPVKPSASQMFASPTESDFSEGDGPDSVKNWAEEKVCEYLRSVKCGEYEKLFRKNHINGENLLEMDKEVLKEMGIDKVGDRVRLFLGIKKLRTKAYANQKKRNRVCTPSPQRTSGSLVKANILTGLLRCLGQYVFHGTLKLPATFTAQVWWISHEQ